MLFYVLAFHRCNHRLNFFLVEESSRAAIEERMRLERDNANEGRLCEEVVAIGASDLYHLMSFYQRYFVEELNPPSIADCFFCRAYLGGVEGVDLNAVELLQSDAFIHGHCIWCHQVYPVCDTRGRRDAYTGLALHISHCDALTIN